MPLISDFLVDLDRRWDQSSTEKVRLPLIGSTALMLQTDYERRTKDGDVLETTDLTTEIKERLLGLAGEGSGMHTRFAAALLRRGPRRGRCRR